MKLGTMIASAVCALVVLSGYGANAAEAHRRPFGQTPDKQAVEAIVLTNRHGVSATVITYGATLQSLIAPGQGGAKADIVLGFDDAADYARYRSYFGASVGRYANRIAKGRFELDGRTYQLALNNNGVTALHGGVQGFDRRVWTVDAVKAGAVASVTLSYVSADGEEGYPGVLKVSVTYALDEQDQLSISYTATTDRPTIVNLTNHALFNMAGEGAPEGAMGNVLTLSADAYTPVDADLIPTGAFTAVAGTPFDFRRPRALVEGVRDGRDPQIAIGHGYDHNYVIRAKAGALRLVARLSDPKSGRTLELLSDQPGLQLYTGNFMDGTMLGKSGKLYRQGDGVALEPQLFPDTPNRPAFGSARLDPGQTYRNRIVFRLTIQPQAGRNRHRP